MAAKRKPKARKKIGFMPQDFPEGISKARKRIEFRGKLYYYWTSSFTLNGAKKNARDATKNGYKVRLFRDRGGTVSVYTSPKVPGA